jgi:peroxiredoxin
MRRNILTAALVFLGALAVAASDTPSGSKPAKPKSVAEQLLAIQKEQKAKQERLTKELERLQTELEQLGEQTANRYFELISRFPKDPAVVPALEYLVIENTSYANKALELLEQHHLQSPRLGKLCLFLCEGEEVNIGRNEKFLRAVVGKNTVAQVQALASLALGRLLYARAEAEGAKPMPRAADLRDAEALLDKVVKKYAKVKLPEQEPVRTAGEEAHPILFEIRHLAIGKTVPDLAGADLDGKAFKLSDYRGKVVLLDFWALSSGASVALLARERQLLARLKDRPFTIIGVNGDDVEERPELLKKTKVPFRSLPNERKDKPPISVEWNLKGWPTLFLIDHKGVIRRKWIGSPGDKALERAIEALVRAAEER